MKVIYSPGKLKKVIDNAVLAIGVFDGMHLGHQKLIRRSIALARKNRGKAVVLTFHPHPVQVLRPETYLPYIVSVPYRLKLIAETGVDICVLEKFTKKFSQLTPQKFVENYLLGFIRPKVIIVGEDFRFGSDREGDLSTFRRLGRRWGFKVNAVTSLKGSQKKIGSTLIRKEIAAGHLTKAEKMLGRPVSIMAKVVRGKSRGRILGFPTANLKLDAEVLPPLGVYAVKVLIEGKRCKGMANIGHRPSFEPTNSPITVEVHLFDFDRNIYGSEIVVEFIKKIRQERKFNSPESLIDQLRKDQKKALLLLK